MFASILLQLSTLIFISPYITLFTSHKEYIAEIISVLEAIKAYAKFTLNDETIINNSPTKLDVPGKPQFAKAKNKKNQLYTGI